MIRSGKYVGFRVVTLNVKEKCDLSTISHVFCITVCYDYLLFLALARLS